MELKETLKKLRTSKNLTVAQLSKLSGVGNGTIGDIESGKNKSTIKTLVKLADAMKLDKGERAELLAPFYPDDIGQEIRKLSKREKSQFDRTIDEAAIYFNNENNSEEDKKKMLDVITELFFDAKLKNKEKYKKNKKK